MKKTISLLALIISLGFTQISNAFLTQLGEGDYMAHMVINFGSGAIYEFDVSFVSDLLWSGRDLMNFVEAETSLVTHQQSFDFGGGPVYFLDGLEFDGHSNIGFDGGDNWWHYWVQDSETGEWEMPMFGFSDRQISNGSWDGWVYGNANPPMLIPEPGTAVLLVVGVLMLGWGPISVVRVANCKIKFSGVHDACFGSNDEIPKYPSPKEARSSNDKLI